MSFPFLKATGIHLCSKNCFYIYFITDRHLPNVLLFFVLENYIFKIIVIDLRFMAAMIETKIRPTETTKRQKLYENLFASKHKPLENA